LEDDGGDGSGGVDGGVMQGREGAVVGGGAQMREAATTVA
jgi:hypothetical protein